MPNNDPWSVAEILPRFPAARLAWLAAVLLAVALFVAPAFAQQDPPARVGRLAEAQGGVWLYSPDSGEWLEAARNLPITTGDRIAVDAGGRAEVRVGSTALRLDGGSDLDVLQLDDEAVRVQLHRGSVAVRLRSGEAARGFELLTDGDGRFTAAQPGRYRIDHGVDAADRVTAWSGEALFQAPDAAVPVLAGERVDLWRDPNGRSVRPVRAQPAADDFAGWVAALDLADDRAAAAAAAAWVPPEMTGAEDLYTDRYGRWESSAEYGPLWQPYGVAAGWAPYREGRWAWVAPWGWTWVDDAPWGFAPFHYGRWAQRPGGRWAWSPGRRAAPPVYAPALVGWGGGPGVSVAVGGGHGAASPAVGWFPLGPREVFVPGYRASPRYLREVNVAQVPNLGDVNRYLADPDAAVRQAPYRHRDVPGAWSVVPVDVFRGRRPVAPALLAPPAGWTAQTPHAGGGVPPGGPAWPGGARPPGDARFGRPGEPRPVDGAVQRPGLPPAFSLTAAAPVEGPPRRQGGGDPRAAGRAPVAGAVPVAPGTGPVRGPLPGGTARPGGGPDMGPTSGAPSSATAAPPAGDRSAWGAGAAGAGVAAGTGAAAGARRPDLPRDRFPPGQSTGLREPALPGRGAGPHDPVPPSPGTGPREPLPGQHARPRDARPAQDPRGPQESARDPRFLQQERQRTLEQQQRLQQLQGQQEQRQRLQEDARRQQEQRQHMLDAQLQEQRRAQDQQRLQEQLRQQEQRQMQQRQLQDQLRQQQEQERMFQLQRMQEQQRQQQRSLLDPARSQPDRPRDPGIWQRGAEPRPMVGRADPAVPGGEQRDIHMRRGPRDAGDR